jgi:hypothetical protein
MAVAKPAPHNRGAASSFFLLQPPFSSSYSTSSLGGLRRGSMVVAAVGGALAPAAPPLPSPLSQNKPANSNRPFLSEQTSTGHQPPAKRTGRKGQTS